MALKNERTEVFQLFGEGSLNELSRAVEGLINDNGYTLFSANLALLAENRFRGVYILTRVVTRAPKVETPHKSTEKASESVMDAVK